MSIKKADIIIADSYSTKRDIVEFFRIKEEKIKVVYLGVESRFYPISNVEEYRLRNNLPSKMILNVGTLEPRKNVVALIRAFKKLKGRGLKDCKLVIAGDKGWLYKRIFDEVKSNDLQKEVLFLGIVEDEDLPMLYNCADIFVYPSLYEGFGLPPLEAMACGIPVITNNYGGQLDYINEDNGWIVKEGSFAPATDPLYIYDWADWFHPTIESWRKIMRKVYENKKEVEAKSKKSLETVKEFTWEKAGQKAIKLLEQY
ncbi:hypothetical protein LCGC14_2574340 [marine sediment metagenome]|uniref:Glycosyl transferase family 1 domain-containing protein n=1 Tax=marine sediment metagenome TaxID=412755 RepID=A0A0F9CSI4_9ZZZZ